MKIHFGHRLGNTTPSTDLLRDFCAGIGPLQLGVLLVLYRFVIVNTNLHKNEAVTDIKHWLEPT